MPGTTRRTTWAALYDVVWLSQVLHGEGPGECRRLVAKATSALKPGGALWVQEFVVDTEAPEHSWPALFSLNMLVNTEDGQGYTAADICGFMEHAGLTGCAFDGPDAGKLARFVGAGCQALTRPLPPHNRHSLPPAYGVTGCARS